MRLATAGLPNAAARRATREGARWNAFRRARDLRGSRRPLSCGGSATAVCSGPHADQGAQALEETRADARHGQQLLRLPEGTVPAAIPDDAPGEDGSDPGQGVQVSESRPVEIHGMRYRDPGRSPCLPSRAARGRGRGGYPGRGRCGGPARMGRAPQIARGRQRQQHHDQQRPAPLRRRPSGHAASPGACSCGPDLDSGPRHDRTALS